MEKGIRVSRLKLKSGQDQSSESRENELTLDLTPKLTCYIS